MGISTFNYTGRKDFLRTGGDNPEIEIKIYDTDKGIKFEPIFNFDKKRDFPEDAIIKIQLYSTSGDNFVSPPYEFGTVTKPKSEIKEVEVAREGLNFSFRIVDKEKNILCLIEPIKPKQGSTLLKYAEREQEEIFHIEVQPDEIPTVWFRKGYGLKTLLKESNFFKVIIFTSAINQVLHKYLQNSNVFEDCEYKKNWIKHFTQLVGTKPPKDEDFYEGNESLTEGEEWISNAISRFTEKPNKKNKKLIEIMPNEEIEISKKLEWKKA